MEVTSFGQLIVPIGLANELADRGRGLVIAKKVLDEISYRRENGRNHWVPARRRFT